MRFLMAIALFACVLTFASTWATFAPRRDLPPFPRIPSPTFPKGTVRTFPVDFSGRRFRRQGSVVLQGVKPLSGPDRRPSLDVNYNHRIFDNGRANADAYGGVNIRPGMPAQPHIGIQAERNYGNGFIRGFGQAQRGPGGRIQPTFGVGAGFRFRRDIGEQEQAFEEQEE